MRYISDLNISFSLLVDGVDRRFSFTPQAKGGSMYIAKTKAEIKALEASDMYGRIYRRMEGQMPPEQAGNAPKPKKGKTAAKAAAPKIQDVQGVETWQEAIEYLANHHGSERDTLTTPDEILAEAAKLNLRFPNLNPA